MASTVAAPIVVMKRYELKYLLDAEKTAYFKKRLEGHMQVDRFGLCSIASLYYDTPDHRLIRESIDGPLYKEKLRLRSYGLATDDSPVYLELKRKAFDIVYKRRAQSTIPQVERFFDEESELGDGGQISEELRTFRDYYRELSPSCLIIYDRTAYFEPGGDLRLTIDSNPRYRTEDLSLKSSLEGIPLLPEGWTILEIKVQDAVPLWLAEILSAGRIYKGSFSKYGEAYRRELKKAGSF